MKALFALLASLFYANASAQDAAADATAQADSGDIHRYLIERTFPAGALEGLDAATKQRVNANNASVGVRWLQSYANAEKTKTFCLYEGPNEDAIRQAAALNALPVDSIVEVPVDLTP